MARALILVVEDDPHMQGGLRAAIEREHYGVEIAGDVPQAAEKLKTGRYDLVITDLKMPNGSGMDVIHEARHHCPSTPVIVITAYGTVEKAVEAMKAGAVDFIQKPFSFQDLSAAIERCLNAWKDMGEETSSLATQGILTRDPTMIRILQRARAVASTKVPVLVQGESGTGKELLARFIHNSSPRASRALVAVNCAAIPENLLESELFGHEKGAFTGATCRKIGKFEQANGSTILLDEIGEMGSALQAKLLRVLQEWEVDRVGGTSPVPLDVRVVATTNADLAQSVRAGKFREDLYFRLNVMPIKLPPLRERPDDILLLAEHFLRRACMDHSKSVTGFSPKAVEKLRTHSWKGNVRELKNVVERAVLLSRGPVVEENEIWLEEFSMPSSRSNASCLEGSLKEVERELILSTLEREGWNRTKASARLGISVRTLRNKLHEYRREGLLPMGLGEGTP